MQHEIQLHIEDDFADKVDAFRLQQAAEAVLESEGRREPLELEIVIAGDATVHELNRRYRGLDETTDVLSFSFLEGAEEEVVPPDGPLHLGEVIISYPQAERQAREAGHSGAEEISLLIVHGVLHLLSYDHEQRGERQRMRNAERRALRLIYPEAAPHAKSNPPG